MAIWKLPASFEVYGDIEVEADSVEDAIQYFENHRYNIPIPEVFNSVDSSSFSLTCYNTDYIKDFQY